MDENDPSARDLVAAVLGPGRRGESAHDLADALLRDWGSLLDLSRARVEELMWTPGIGPAKAAAIVAAFALSRRASVDSGERIILADTSQVARVAHRELAHRDRECLLVLVANASLRLVHTEIVAMGTADWAPVTPVDVLTCVMRHKGRAFALAHNHPGGEPVPSDDDRDATERMSRAAEVVGLHFLCHVVIADDRWQYVEPMSARAWRHEEERRVSLLSDLELADLA